MIRAAAAVAALLLAACQHPRTSPTPEAARRPYAVIPNPAEIQVSARDSFLVTPRTGVFVAADASDEVAAIGTYTADLLASQSGATVQRLTAGAAVPDSSIRLTLDPTQSQLGDEGYELTVQPTHVEIIAAAPAGLFHGVQTMRQLLPPSVEHQAAIGRRLAMPVAHVVDTPRFAWRGAMLDVSRHFLPPADVKRFIDYMALYKLNRLHLHLSDDQGWRIEIKSWPNLTAVSGQTAVGGAPAGFYTQEQYADIVNYARSRYVTIVPEIDMPGHMNAALVAYPDLKCDRVAPPPFLKTGGPPNSLCVDRDSTYQFVSNVVHEITSLAPTPYFSIGGDEVRNLSRQQYTGFIERVERIVDSTGARMVGWGEIAPAQLNPSTIVQIWNPDSSQLQVARGGKVIMSASPHMYFDMKYDSATVLGLHWAGYVTLQKAYDWDPATFKPGVGENAILGVESPLWAETLIRRQDYEFMAFPRLTAVAEVGWTPQSRRDWNDFRRRVGAQGARMAALGINFARVPGVSWSW